MALCPHCREDCIGYLARVESWAGGPVRCGKCGGLSFLPSQSTAPGRIASLLITLSPIVAIAAVWLVGSLWALLLVVVPVIVLLVAHEITLHRRPLVPTTASEVAYSRRWGFGFAIVVVLVAVVVLAITFPPFG